MFVLVAVDWVMIYHMIGNPASSEMVALNHFLHAKITNALEIHRELHVVYGQVKDP
jgi:hypothetical protein